MVYPIVKFAYSFTQRLQELAIPTETYNLQLADVDQIVFQKSPKKPAHFELIGFTWNDLTKQIVVSNDFNVISIDQLPDVFTAREVKVSGFHLSLFFTHSVLKRFVFNPLLICISHSDIDDDVINLLKNCSTISFEKCCRFKPDFSVFSITKNFNALYIYFEFDLIDRNFFIDLNKVFSRSKKRTYINIYCEFEDLKQKFNSYNLPCFSFEEDLNDIPNGPSYVTIGFHVKNVTSDEANLFLKPFKNHITGPKLNFFENSYESIISVTNEACFYS